MASLQVRAVKPRSLARLTSVRLLLVCFVLCFIVWVLALLGARWLIVRESVEHPDVIVVLSGSATLKERTQHAAQLWAQHGVQKVLITLDTQQGGWSFAEQRNPYFYEIVRSELIRLGVPPESIEVLNTPVTSTWDEAVAIKHYSELHHLSSILIVTSAYHSRRALWTFRTLLRGTGITVGIDPAETGFQTPRPSTWWLHKRGWQLVFVEYLKLIYYRFRGLGVPASGSLVVIPH